MRLKGRGVRNFPLLEPSNSFSTHHLPFIFLFHGCEGATLQPRSLNAGHGEENLRLALRPRTDQSSLPLRLLKSQVD